MSCATRWPDSQWVVPCSIARPAGSEQARKAALDRRPASLATWRASSTNLLDVTRIVRGKVRLEPRPVDFRELVARTAEDYRASFAAHELGLEVHLPPTPMWIEADKAIAWCRW